MIGTNRNEWIPVFAKCSQNYLLFCCYFKCLFFTIQCPTDPQYCSYVMWMDDIYRLKCHWKQAYQRTLHLMGMLWTLTLEKILCHVMSWLMWRNFRCRDILYRWINSEYEEIWHVQSKTSSQKLGRCASRRVRSVWKSVGQVRFGSKMFWLKILAYLHSCILSY